MSQPAGTTSTGRHHPNISFSIFKINDFSGLHHQKTQLEGIVIGPMMCVKMLQKSPKYEVEICQKTGRKNTPEEEFKWNKPSKWIFKSNLNPLERSLKNDNSANGQS